MMNEETKMKIVTGKPNYVAKKVEELKKEGYIIGNRHVHPNGDVTVRMIKL
jgi:hypothetical protein